MAHPITNIGSCGWCVVRADSQQLVLASESLQHWMPVSPQPSSLRKHHLHNHTHEQFNNALSHPSSAIRPDMSSDLKETTELPQITRLSDLFSDSIDMDWECFCISSSKQVLQPSMFRCHKLVQGLDEIFKSSRVAAAFLKALSFLLIQ
ncbi:hypothetical protein BDEG_20391 [Batrachochytrium dendrobatidis JEL423]|uniref:Uncharacterized protein n=1 Tax=Batrachochytrium dendrobatidis (strain JEL423) TaxID=403673 RepID=A0A177W8U7_BATDL|nr:hypothetical protein BDEG_20391 [Batrachochytrium dendrobatidis JEL423]